MARTATKTARILSDLYDETFAHDSTEPFRISWPDLRCIAGVPKLTHGYLRKVNQELNETGYTLIQFDNFLVIIQESDLSHIRSVPPRIVEQYLYEDGDDFEFDDEEEDIPDLGDLDDCEINDEDVAAA